MIQIHQEDLVEALALFKTLYLQQATAPLDGMWLIGFVPQAQHYGFYLESELIGCCCVNEEARMFKAFATHLLDGEEQHRCSEGDQRCRIYCLMKSNRAHPGLNL